MTRWPTNLWNVSVKRKSNSRRIVVSATFSTYVEMSQRIPSINGNVERFLGVSYVQSIDATKESPRRYCVEIGMQVEASWPIAIVSHRFSIHLNRFVCRMLDPPSRRTNLDPCFLFFFFLPFSVLFSFHSNRPIRSWHGWLFDLVRSIQMDHRCCSILQTDFSESHMEETKRKYSVSYGLTIKLYRRISCG